MFKPAYERWIQIAKNQKQPKCASIEECINKLWHILTVEYFFNNKKGQTTETHSNNEYISIHYATWKTQKATYFMIPVIWHSEKGKTLRTEHRSGVNDAMRSDHKGSSTGECRHFPGVMAALLLWITAVVNAHELANTQTAHQKVLVNLSVWKFKNKDFKYHIKSHLLVLNICALPLKH